eukprot:m.498785 g.498785  ORF g.498785 m.498785 type:complete len:154 (-) comp21822_c0_seq59:143-604(-)
MDATSGIVSLIASLVCVWCMEQVINANEGGPYGGDVLDQVQEASDRVWSDVWEDVTRVRLKHKETASSSSDTTPTGRLLAHGTSTDRTTTEATVTPTERKPDADTCTVGHDWYRACIAVTAHATQPWTARAVRADGSLGREFEFATPSQDRLL